MPTALGAEQRDERLRVRGRLNLRELHDALDEAVAAAYGWPASAAHDPHDSNRRLLELNRAIAAGEIGYRPFV